MAAWAYASLGAEPTPRPPGGPMLGALPRGTTMPTKPPPPSTDELLNEEPEIVQEESVPSDGKDTKGEKMMEELGRHKPQPPAPAR